MEKLKGYVDRIIFRNKESGYTVLVLKSGQGETTCVGMLSCINEGEMIEVEGQYVAHAMYGKQFKAESFEIRKPEDEQSIERYLSSGAVKGIGAALASRIVQRFHEDAFRIIEEEPERLAEIKGISPRKAREIADQVYEKRDMRQAAIFLQKFGISTAMSVKIYQKYGNDIYKVMQENPYRLADDITGIGFRIADDIARKAGIRQDSEYRIKCGIMYALQQSVSEGHVCLPQEELMRKAAELLGGMPENQEQYLTDLAIERKIVVKEEQGIKLIYGAAAYRIELDTARMLNDLNITAPIDEKLVLQKISVIEKASSTQLDEMQRQAVVEAVRCGLLVITGGPGTGKTTIINTLITYFESEGLDILLAAPTGRAAKRMTETTGCEAKTIHRMLEISAGKEGNSGNFARDEKNPLEADVIIVDEMSMVDIYLMHALLGAVTVGTRLIMVGDVNQLPSVGPGSVLKDIISSGCIQVVRLTRIFRQASESDIVVNAHRINRGEQVPLDNKSLDFFFLKRQDVNVIISIVIQLVRDKMPRYVNASVYDIQVLTPMRKGLLGVERLNRILQEYLNPPSKNKAEHEYGEMLFREGDKVMQIRNNYQTEWEIRGKHGVAAEKGLGIFNGDMGIIREINPHTECMTVEFDDHRMVEYPFSGLDELELSYAVTIHKSQGSEYPAIVIPLLSGPRMLMNRNLLYTAVTRARKCVTLVGDDATFQQMIRNTMEQRRYTTLAQRIRELNGIK